MKNSKAGMTLIEVIVASAILGVVALMAMTILTTSTHLGSNGTRMSEVEQRGNRLLNYLHDELSTAQFTSASFTSPALGIVSTSNNTALVYQVTGPATGTATGNMTLTAGYPAPQTQTVDPTLACVLRFEADTVFMESAAAGPLPAQAATWTNPSNLFPTLPPLPFSNGSPYILNFDLDGNHSLNDVFVQGRIMKYIVNSAGPVMVEQLDGDVILKVSGSNPGQFQGDMDGDGKADLLFTYLDATGAPTATYATAAGIQINVWHGRPDDTGKAFILRNNKMTIHFRN